MATLQTVVAGADTTMASLTAIMFHLVKYPEVLAKLRNEIEMIAQNSVCSAPFSFKQTQAMPYLQAVIKEALRVYPAVGLPLEWEVPVGGVELCGYFFPAGTVVGVNPWVMHYNTSVWGSDAANFRPERWLEADNATLAMMRRCWILFGVGSRTCIGRHMSMLEIAKAVPELLRRFDFALCDEKRVQGSGLELLNHWFVIPRALHVRAELRHDLPK